MPVSEARLRPPRPERRGRRRHRRKDRGRRGPRPSPSRAREEADLRARVRGGTTRPSEPPCCGCTRRKPRTSCWDGSSHLSPATASAPPPTRGGGPGSRNGQSRGRHGRGGTGRLCGRTHVRAGRGSRPWRERQTGREGEVYPCHLQVIHQTGRLRNSLYGALVKIAWRPASESAHSLSEPAEFVGRGAENAREPRHRRWAGGPPAPSPEALPAGGSGAQALSLAPDGTGDYGVGDAYPNPARAEAFIPISIPTEAPCSVDVFSVDGRLGAGRHTLHVQTAGLAAGVYVARVTVDGAPHALSGGSWSLTDAAKPARVRPTRPDPVRLEVARPRRRRGEPRGNPAGSSGWRGFAPAGGCRKFRSKKACNTV